MERWGCGVCVCVCVGGGGGGGGGGGWGYPQNADVLVVLVVNWTLKNKQQENFNQNTTIFFEKNNNFKMSPKW